MSLSLSRSFSIVLSARSSHLRQLARTLRQFRQGRSRSPSYPGTAGRQHRPQSRLPGPSQRSPSEDDEKRKQGCDRSIEGNASTTTTCLRLGEYRTVSPGRLCCLGTLGRKTCKHEFVTRSSIGHVRARCAVVKVGQSVQSPNSAVLRSTQQKKGV